MEPQLMDPTDYLFEGAETYSQKQEDYGDSWRLVGYMMYAMADGEVVLDTPQDFISFGLFTRRLDKIARAFNGEFNVEDMNFESIEDAHADESVYAAMSASNVAESETPEVAIDHPTVIPDDPQ